MDKQPYIVYVCTDDQARIIDIHSSAFLMDVTGWTEIDSGYGDRYRLAQTHYLENPIRDLRKIPRYKLEDGLPVERTQKEMDADYIPPVPVPDPTERIAALEAAMTAIEEGIASV